MVATQAPGEGAGHGTRAQEVSTYTVRETELDGGGDGLPSAGIP